MFDFDLRLVVVIFFFIVDLVVLSEEMKCVLFGLIDSSEFLLDSLKML